MPIQRIKMTVAYRGTAYHGWQEQGVNPTWKGPPPPAGQGMPTVQETLRRAVRKVVKHEVSVVGSSRTDSGVHAKGQIAHFDTNKVTIPNDGLRRAINSKLPGDILVRRVELVPMEFNAILSTVAKRYQYVIWSADDRPVLTPDLAWHRWKPLDVPAMAAAARHLVGTHDFASFARPGHGRLNTVRTVDTCTVSHRSPRIVIGVEGSGFLWHMVRIIVGTLVEVGMGQLGGDDLPRILAAKDRRAAGTTAPAHGLYLQWVRMNDQLSGDAPAAEGGDDE